MWIAASHLILNFTSHYLSDIQNSHWCEERTPHEADLVLSLHSSDYTSVYVPRDPLSNVLYFSTFLASQESVQT